MNSSYLHVSAKEDAFEIRFLVSDKPSPILKLSDVKIVFFPKWSDFSKEVRFLTSDNVKSDLSREVR